jgi:hypothetical protein
MRHHSSTYKICSSLEELAGRAVVQAFRSYQYIFIITTSTVLILKLRDTYLGQFKPLAFHEVDEVSMEDFYTTTGIHPTQIIEQGDTTRRGI